MTDKTSTHIKTELAKFNITDAAIATMSKEYLLLNINGIDDKDGYDKVHAARMVVKGFRVGIDKTRKLLKADALAFGKAVDGEAKRITELLGRIEGHLSDQETAIDDEKERIKREKVEAIRAEQERKEQEERDRIAAEEEAARLAREKVMAEEEARLEAERKRQAAIDVEQGERAAILKAAEDKVEAEKQEILEAKQKAEDEIKRQAELEKAKKEAAEAARIEAEKKAEREAEDKAAAEQKAKFEAERQEALKPDKDKLIALAEALNLYPLPEIQDIEAKKVRQEVRVKLRAIATFIREFTDAK